MRIFFLDSTEPGLSENHRNKTIAEKGKNRIAEMEDAMGKIFFKELYFLKIFLFCFQALLKP